VQRTRNGPAFPRRKPSSSPRPTLETLGDLIGGTAHDLAVRLPEISAEWLDEPAGTPAQNYGVEGFVSRVRDIATEVMDDDITPASRPS
jgi:hypothetical protein